MEQQVTKKSYEEFGALVRAARMRDGLSMEDLALVALGKKNQKGIISSLEKGTGSISLERATLLIKKLARNEEERRDFLVAFAMHSGTLPVRGLDKASIRRVVEQIESLQAEAKAKPKRRKKAEVEATAAAEAGRL